MATINLPKVMVWVDFLIIALLIYAVWVGWRQGLVTQVLGLVAIALGIFLAWRYGGDVGAWFGLEGTGARVAGFAVVLVVVVVGAALVGRLTRGLFRIVGLGVFDNVLGAAFSAFKVLLVAGLVVWLIESVDTGGKVLSERVRERSTMLHVAEAVAGAVCPFVRNLIN